ncbi:MAG: MmoB/DmpM family protein [archaeon]|nr:MmoB/DmpM family protein [archaeon]
MVSVFLEAVPANILVAEAVCNDNKDNNANYTCFGMMIRIRGDKRLILKRGVIEEAIGRGLTENEWQSVTWLYIGSISKCEQNEAVFEDSEESKVVDRYWDDQLESIKRET